MTIRIAVTRAQVDAARAMVRRWERAGRPVREAVRQIAEARTNKPDFDESWRP